MMLILALLALNCWGYAGIWHPNMHYLIYSPSHSHVEKIIISSTLPGRTLRLDGLYNLAMNVQLMRGTFEHHILHFGLELWKTLP